MSEEKPSFAVQWLFTVAGTKSTFDYIRNIGLISLLLVSAAYVGHSILGSPLHEIANSKSYQSLCDTATTGYETHVKDAVKANVRLYFEGFKEGGGRTFSVMEKSEHQEIKYLVGSIEYRKKKQYEGNHILTLSEGMLYITSATLFFANTITYLLQVNREISHTTYVARRKRIAMWLERSVLLALFLICTLSILLSVYQSRDNLFGNDEKSHEEIVQYAEFLGMNEYEDMLDYISTCKR